MLARSKVHSVAFALALAPALLVATSTTVAAAPVPTAIATLLDENGAFLAAGSASC
jgi:hypothetical protein